MGIFDDLKESFNNYFANSTPYQKSSTWMGYHLGKTLTHCPICFDRNNKIYLYTEIPFLPEHENCACFLDWLDKVNVGYATKLGNNGADYYLNYFGKLPDYYITSEQAKTLGWNSKLGNLNKIVLGKMIGGDLFKNKENKLPNAIGRVWYKCDIDYSGGFRNNLRLIYSNDGLIFLTNNHYSNFIAVEM